MCGVVICWIGVSLICVCVCWYIDMLFGFYNCVCLWLVLLVDYFNGIINGDGVEVLCCVVWVEVDIVVVDVGVFL